MKTQTWYHIYVQEDKDIFPVQKKTTRAVNARKIIKTAIKEGGDCVCLKVTDHHRKTEMKTVFSSHGSRINSLKVKL